MTLKKKELIELIKKYRRGKASPEEIVFLEKYYQYFDKEEKVSESLTENEIKETGSNIFLDIQSSIRQAPVIPLYRRLSFRIAAASILLIVSFGTYYLYLNKNNQPPETNAAAVKQDIAPPALNRATITLANGQKVYLDSAANGTLATQGNAKIVKLADGQIAYSIDGNVTTEVQFNTLSTPYGSQYKLKLPDGTEVWLNAASSITYPTAFAGKDRGVTITGEVYFEVTKDKTKPFHVKVNDMEVEVLGTHFNINSYADEADIKTTLLEGSVKVVNGQSAMVNRQSVILKPGEQAILAANSPFTIDHSPDIDQVMAWKNGLFNFNKVSLQEVMRQIARWYDVDVVYQGEIKPKKFGGEIQRDLNLSEVLEGLKETGIHFRIEGKKLIVLP